MRSVLCAEVRPAAATACWAARYSTRSRT